MTLHLQASVSKESGGEGGGFNSAKGAKLTIAMGLRDSRKPQSSGTDVRMRARDTKG